MFIQRKKPSIWSFQKLLRYFHGDSFFELSIRLSSVFFLVLLSSFFVFLCWGSWPAIKKLGFSFLSSLAWDPVHERFGVLPVIYGTIVSSFIAIVLSFPLSVGAALFVSQLAPRFVARPIAFLIEMLAAIPSVVYGLWGLFVLCPLIKNVLQPWLQEHLGFLPWFQGPRLGIGLFSAGLILAIMIAPTIFSLSREIFQTVPRTLCEAVLALGATRWEMLRLAFLRTSFLSLLGAGLMALGRALGETMAVTMVIGNRTDIVFSLFAPSQTMASLIANEYAEAFSEIHLSALTAIGLTLFLLTLITNSCARMIIRSRIKRK